MLLPTTSASAILDRWCGAISQEAPDEEFPLGGSFDRRIVGVGSFGPVDLRRASPTWGTITTTPKPGWADTDVLGALSAAGMFVACGSVTSTATDGGGGS